ncbi:DUF5591 domain-containing protein [Pseudooceanicola sp. 200-1SW]|uniref:DUF5591 domain-containing protein n=1 Tax=Pseudooceanicola sp. 200-1SW TaxID=3425949 RepID=UPI003D7F324B
MSNQVIVEDKAARFLQSQEKIQAPYELDPELCLYCPQDNMDSLSHPRIADWIEFVTERYMPPLPEGGRKVLLMMPCTATKPYPFSTEHRAINRRLYDEGFRPVARQPLAQELCARLGPDDPQELLDVSILSDGKGTYIHRAVISEPMALVPYETITGYEGKPSPCHAYDDPGLFEKRGNAVSPWREDSTAVQVGPSKWAWGDNEKRAYVEMHNEMARLLAKAMERIGGLYDARISWVAPGLTHRSFVLERAARKAHGVPAFKKVAGENLAFTGANDLLPEHLKITCLPLAADCTDAIERLAKRLGTTPDRVGSHWSRGGANATPLALPELLDVLVENILEKEDA